MKSISENGFVLSSNYDGSSIIKDDTLRRSSSGSWSKILNNCYSINASSGELSLEVEDMNRCDTKFGLDLLLLDENDIVFKMSIDSLDLSKYVLTLGI